MSEIWFARRFPVGHKSNSMAPVHWKGWAMFAGFAAAMILGGVGFAISAISGKVMMGLVAFVSLSALGGGLLLISVIQNGDQTKTVQDYARNNQGA